MMTNGNPCGMTNGNPAWVSLLRRMLLAALVCALIPASQAADIFIIVASTTSTEQSGLFAFLLPAFEKQSGIEVRVVALGTGQALDVARRGDADVVFVHDPAAEEKFIADYKIGGEQLFFPNAHK